MKQILKALLTGLGLLPLIGTAHAEFRQIAEIVAPKDTALLKSIELATRDPRTYLQSSPPVLARFPSLEKAAADRSLPWLVLIDGLIKHNIVIEFDWKLDPTVRLNSDSLRGFQELPSDLQEQIEKIFRSSLEKEEDTGTFLHAAGKALSGTRKRLVMMRINSDSLPVLLLSESHLAILREQARKLRTQLKLQEEELDFVDLALRVY